MSIDRLQHKIRKWKNPSVVEFVADISLIPPAILEEYGDFEGAYLHYCGRLLDELKNIVPAVRFSFNGFALYGSQGLSVLEKATRQAHDLGYYVLLDVPVSYTDRDAIIGADVFAKHDCPWYCDGIVVSAYIGSDAIKPYADTLATGDKALFVLLRTGNKSAAQLQDLLTGARLMHTALADMVARVGRTDLGRSNYRNVSYIGSAPAADSLKTLRSKYKNTFILVEGYDYPNANAKNCSYAFDSLGHGAAVCAGTSILGAWQEEENIPCDYLQSAVAAAERMKKNLLRYITIV